MKILTISVARLQFIKASFVSAAIQKSTILEEKTIYTNQSIENVLEKNI